MGAAEEENRFQFNTESTETTEGCREEQQVLGIKVGENADHPLITNQALTQL